MGRALKNVPLIMGGLAVLMAGYLAVAAFLWVRQPQFIFFPETTIQKTPQEYGVPYETVTLPIGTTEQLYGWWLPAPNSSRVLLYLHGNGGNIGANAEHAARLQRLGFSVLLLDYRGYGKSMGGFPNEAQVYADAQRSWEYLVQTRQIAPQQITIYGHSLGGAIASDLAQKHPEAAGLIVESSFTSMLAMTTRQSWTRFFPVDWLLHQRFDSLAKIPKLQMPVLLIHGTADSIIPFAMGQALWAAAPEPKRLLLIPGGEHNNDAQTAPILYQKAVLTFCQQIYPL